MKLLSLLPKPFSVAMPSGTPSEGQSMSERTYEPAMSYPLLSANPLSPADTIAFADELDALYQATMQDLGARDARYIRRVYATVVYTEMLGRGLLLASGWLAGANASWADTPTADKLSTKKSRKSLKKATALTWLAGTACLTLSKVLNNMELGHNVMHGQYDWMQDPHLNSREFDWDIVCPAPLWQHSHNYLHHTFTNIVGRDHDVGYHLFRITDAQRWKPSDRYNPLKVVFIALGFQWAVGFHDIQISIEEYRDSPDLPSIMRPKSRAFITKILRQVGKDYVVMPLLAQALTGKRGAVLTGAGNLTANLTRNVWTWAVIFCGHFTEQAHMYTHLPHDESKGDWYVRQLLGSSNLTGSKLFHILTGNLSHQIEHHLFPDMPANRYADIAPKVQALCAQYGLPYNTGSFGSQFTQVMQRIHHYSRPDAGSAVKAVAVKAEIDSAMDNERKVTRLAHSVAQSVPVAQPTKASDKSRTYRKHPEFPQVSERRARVLERLPLFLAQAVAYV